MTAELKYTLTLALIVLLLAAAYGLRVAVKGRAHFDRIDHAGGSRLLSKGVMELGYWALQPAATLCVRFSVKPNQLSWASLAFGFLAGACLAFGLFGFGAIFAAFSGLLDCLDGMVARLSGLASEGGKLLDAAVDRYAEGFLLSGLAIYYREVPMLQVLTLSALLGSFMVSYSTAKAEAVGVDPPRGSMRRPERAVYLTTGAATSALTVAWMENSNSFVPAVGYPMVIALGLVAALANVSAIRRLHWTAKAVRARGIVPKQIRTADATLQEPGGSRADPQPTPIRPL